MRPSNWWFLQLRLSVTIVCIFCPTICVSVIIVAWERSIEKSQLVLQYRRTFFRTLLTILELSSPSAVPLSSPCARSSVDGRVGTATSDQHWRRKQVKRVERNKWSRAPSCRPAFVCCGPVEKSSRPWTLIQLCSRWNSSWLKDGQW